MHPKSENGGKTLRWLGDSRSRLCEFPEAARRRAGFELWEIQQGNEPSDWKAMPSVGAGVNEIRVHTKGEHRVMYVAKFNEAVYVLHAFEKKTQRTAQHDIDMARARYRALIEGRRRERS
ncbi:MAG: type II toxin-antitoxin system RelE/ParE family toxin [Proteobacteria bacterium]|nr:type II toxin-antitoxin system RelE/ParE family toxin [Pseudomonadota bacterium]